MLDGCVGVNPSELFAETLREISEQHQANVGALANELGYFADCIRRGEAPSVITAEEAGRAFAVMAAAEQSAELGAPVDFEFSETT